MVQIYLLWFVPTMGGGRLLIKKIRWVQYEELLVLPSPHPPHWQPYISIAKDRVLYKLTYWTLISKGDFLHQHPKSSLYLSLINYIKLHNDLKLWFPHDASNFSIPDSHCKIHFVPRFSSQIYSHFPISLPISSIFLSLFPKSTHFRSLYPLPLLYSTFSYCSLGRKESQPQV